MRFCERLRSGVGVKASTSSPWRSKGRLPSSSPVSVMTQRTRPASAGSLHAAAMAAMSTPAARRISKVRAFTTWAAGARWIDSRRSTTRLADALLRQQDGSRHAHGAGADDEDRDFEGRRHVSAAPPGRSRSGW